MMSSTQEVPHTLLRSAEAWSEARLEEEYPRLLETATASLTLSDSSYEVKLECIRYIKKIVKWRLYPTNIFFEMDIDQISSTCSGV